MFRYYLKRALAKLIIVPLWLISIVLNFISKPFTFIARLACIIIGTVSFITLGFHCFYAGWSINLLVYGIIGIACIALFMVFANLPIFICCLKEHLKEKALEPIVIKPPEPFTYKPVYT